jgi:hypothetical protein
VFEVHSEVQVPAKISVETFADSSLVVVESFSPQLVDRKIINVRKIRYLFIIYTQKL